MALQQVGIWFGVQRGWGVQAFNIWLVHTVSRRALRAEEKEIQFIISDLLMKSNNDAVCVNRGSSLLRVFGVDRLTLLWRS